jgi:hypothetical protein
MKKMISVLALVMLLVFGFTQVAISAESAKIDWKQATADLPYVQEWIIYSGDVANPTVELTRIPYTGGGSYTSTVPITVTGTPGTKVRKYFSISAVSKNGTVTAKVAGATVTVPPLAYLEFTVPYPNVSAPFEVIISIIGTP